MNIINLLKLAVYKHFSFYKKRLQLDEKRFVFWGTLSFYLLTIFNPNNKTLILLFGLLIIIYQVRLKNIYLSLFLAFVASSIFLVGQTYFINLIPAEQIWSKNYPEGRNIALIIKVSDILAFTMLFFLVKDTIRFKKAVFPIDIFTILLFFYCSWAMFSAAFFSRKSGLSVLFSLQLFECLIFFLFYRAYLLKSKKIIAFLLSCFLAIIIFEGLLTSLQFVKNSSLGTKIEAYRASNFGVGAEENRFSYRPVGTFFHPNELANFSLPLLLIIFSYLYHQGNRRLTLIAITALFFGGIILVSAASRSAWLSFIIGLLFFLFFIEKVWKYRLNPPKISVKKLLLPLLSIATIVGLIVPGRIMKSFYSFEPYGGFYARQKLTKEAVALIQKHPWVGVGLGMNLLATFEQNLTGVPRSFPEAVHNGFLIIASESGIPALLFFGAFLFLFARKTLVALPLLNKNGKIICIMAVGAIISLSINMFFQPFTNVFLCLLISLFIFCYF